MLRDRLQQARVVGDTELVGHREQQGVGALDGGVGGQLLRDLVGLAVVAAPEARDDTLQVADLVLALVAAGWWFADSTRRGSGSVEAIFPLDGDGDGGGGDGGGGD